MNKQKGFTLTEVLVSIIIFAIGILGMMALEVVATKGAVIGNNNTVATYLAQSVARQLEGLPLTASALTSGNHGYSVSTDPCLLCNNCGAPVNTAGECVSGNNNGYHVSWTVTKVTTANSGTTNNLSSIAVMVSWANGRISLTLPAAVQTPTP